MPTSSVTLAVGTDDGDFTASALITANKVESFSNVRQFWRFNGLAVPSYRRCVVDSAVMVLTGNTGLTSFATETVVLNAQLGPSAPIVSGADATARPRTTSVQGTLNSAMSGSSCVMGITPLVAEAIFTPAWTTGSAVTVFAQRLSMTGLGFAFSWYEADQGYSRPVLYVAWHPAGDVAGPVVLTVRSAGRKATTGRVPVRVTAVWGARTGAKNVTAPVGATTGLTVRRRGRRGAYSFVPVRITGVSGTSAGTRSGNNSTRGGTALTGVRTGRAGRRGVTAGGITPSGVGSAVADRRGGVSGRTVIAGALTVRPGHPATLIHTTAAPGEVTGAAQRQGAPTGTAAFQPGLTASPRRSGVIAGRATVAGTAQGLAASQGAVAGSLAPAATTTGYSDRSTSLAGSLIIVGTPGGGVVHQGDVSGALENSGTVTGSRETSASVEGSAEVTGAVDEATPGREGELAEAAEPSGLTTGLAARDASVGGRLRPHGSVSSHEARSGSLDGDLDGTAILRGRAVRTGRITAITFGSVLRWAVRGQARHAGALVPGRMPAPVVHASTVRVARSGRPERGVLAGRHTDTGLTGRSGSVHGRTAVAAATLTGQAGRRGASVGAWGTPAGLTTGRTAHTGALAGTATLSGAPLRVLARRSGALSNRLRALGQLTGRFSTTLNLAGLLPPVNGVVTGNRSGAGSAPGGLVPGGAVRGQRIARGQVLGLLRSAGNLTATTSRQDTTPGEALPESFGLLRGVRGGQGATSGHLGMSGTAGAPRDHTGATVGTATLRYHLVGTIAPPAEVPHTIVRTVPSRPSAPAAVTVKSVRKGRVTRG